MDGQTSFMDGGTDEGNDRRTRGRMDGQTDDAGTRQPFLLELLFLPPAPGLCFTMGRNVFVLFTVLLCGTCRATAPPPQPLWPPLRIAALRALPTATFSGWLYMRTAMAKHASPMHYKHPPQASTCRRLPPAWLRLGPPPLRHSTANVSSWAFATGLAFVGPHTFTLSRHAAAFGSEWSFADAASLSVIANVSRNDQTHCIWATAVDVGAAYLVAWCLARLVDQLNVDADFHLQDCALWTSWLASTATLQVLLINRKALVAVTLWAIVAALLRLAPPACLWFPRHRHTNKRSRSSSMSSSSGAAAKRIPKNSICPDCVAECSQAPARARTNDTWCRGLCKRHASMKGYHAPGRSVSTSPRRSPSLRGHRRAPEHCPECSAEGRKTPARTEAWCQGLCQRHATARGYCAPTRAVSPVRRSPSLRGHRRAPELCPDCSAEGRKTPARTEAWCQGLCQRHATARGYCAATCDALLVRRSPARPEELTTRDASQRRRKCADKECDKRAQRSVFESPGVVKMYCKRHGEWYRVREVLFFFETTFRIDRNICPYQRPDAETELCQRPPFSEGCDGLSQIAYWLRRQKRRLFYKRLNSDQSRALRALPCGALSYTEWIKERRQRAEQARRREDEARAAVVAAKRKELLGELWRQCTEIQRMGNEDRIPSCHVWSCRQRAQRKPQQFLQNYWDANMDSMVRRVTEMEGGFKYCVRHATLTCKSEQCAFPRAPAPWARNFCVICARMKWNPAAWGHSWRTQAFRVADAIEVLTAAHRTNTLKDLHWMSSTDVATGPARNGPRMGFKDAADILGMLVPGDSQQLCAERLEVYLNPDATGVRGRENGEHVTTAWRRKLEGLQRGIAMPAGDEEEMILHYAWEGSGPTGGRLDYTQDFDVCRRDPAFRPDWRTSPATSAPKPRFVRSEPWLDMGDNYNSAPLADHEQPSSSSSAARFEAPPRPHEDGHRSDAATPCAPQSLASEVSLDPPSDEDVEKDYFDPSELYLPSPTTEDAPEAWFRDDFAE
jgi:hypothetical protein